MSVLQLNDSDFCKKVPNQKSRMRSALSWSSRLGLPFVSNVRVVIKMHLGKVFWVEPPETWLFIWQLEVSSLLFLVVWNDRWCRHVCLLSESFNCVTKNSILSEKTFIILNENLFQNEIFSFLDFLNFEFIPLNFWYLLTKKNNRGLHLVFLFFF